MCRGELIGKVGEDTALKWIAKGKLEKGEDSDGDSVYRKKRKLETSGTKHQKEYLCVFKHLNHCLDISLCECDQAVHLMLSC
eukprot:5922616-Alexandrium_andersonii.AAC.1